MGSGKFSIEFTETAFAHLQFWAKSGQLAIHRRIEKIIESIKETPATGIGKPELLKHNLSGTFSRRINQEHRIIYRVKGNSVLILSLKGHYELKPSSK